MAREAKLPANETGAQPAIVYASSEVHMSIPKAMAMLGLGRQNLRLIPVNEDFRINIEALRAAIEEDEQSGKRAIAIIASAGTVNQSSLESSTVDLGTEFTNMIVVQRAYSAATKIVTTADSMLTDLLNVVQG